MLWIEFVILSFLSACLEVSFQEYQQDKMIFDWYKNLLVDFSQGKAMWRKKIALLLGLCPYCNGFWVSVCVYLYVYEISLYILLFTGLNYFFIKVILKIIR